MARDAREKSGTGTYHVMMRGINHQDIFLDDADKERFVHFLCSAVTHNTNLSGNPSGRYKIYAYALMGNHFHLHVKVESGQLGELVKKIAAGYVRYFNKRHKRDGHLFKERFKSEPCENFNYFCILMGYIHQNPIKHKFAKTLDEYAFTSWAEYSGKYNPLPKVCAVEDVFSKMSLDDIKDCIVEMLPANLKCIDIDIARNQISDDSIREYIKDKYGIADPLEIQKMKLDKRKAILSDLLDYGGAVRQLSRISGVNAMTISRLKALQNTLSPL